MFVKIALLVAMSCAIFVCGFCAGGFIYNRNYALGVWCAANFFMYLLAFWQVVNLLAPY